MDLSRERLRAHYTRVLEANRPLSVLVEGPAPKIEGLEPGAWFSGYTPNYFRVLIPAEQVSTARGSSVTVRASGFRVITNVGDLALIAKRLD